MRATRSTDAAAGTTESTESTESGESTVSAAPVARRRPDLVQRLLGAVAAVLVTGGLVLVGGAGLNLWSRVHRIEASQAKLVHAVDAAWPPIPVRPAGRGGAGGQAIPAGQDTAAGQGSAGQDSSGAVARLHIPRLRLDLVVVEGSADADLLRGPGHIPGTPLPGQPGNVGIAGHRYPGVFWDLDRLHPGDPVVLETSRSWYVYRVDREMTVGPSDVDVLSPHPAGAPTGARDLLTLVTCDPVFTTLRRLIRQAVLVRTTPRADGAPPELTG
ncbi:class E sortase [Planosporangium thailandense]|uniref:Class E sortase n=1 Tax=Planosporangium thailandense TaxID=765197 RepID=A0ABX0Y094_9ACTN|nr:sortase [Planosporangium thailandense]NJC71759.1 class E sortase [Planosporangium thailandense]